MARLMVGTKASGKQDRRHVYGKTQGEVRRKLRELVRQQEHGLLTDADKAGDTLGAFLERWLEAVAGGLRPKSLSWYRRMVEVHIVPVLGKHKLTKLRPDAVQRLYSAKLAAGLAPRSVLHIHRVLHRALVMAVQWGYVPRNVCDVVQSPKVPKKELQPPTPSHLARLLDTARTNGKRWAPLWTLAAYSGCRLGELLARQWKDIDFDAGTLTVRRTLQRVSGGVPLFGEPKSARSRRTITLPPEALRALRTQRARQAEERLMLGPDYARWDLVFATTLGTALGARNVQRAFKAALVHAGLPRTVRFHDLRHAHATALLKAGVHPKIASERLGHSSVALTLDTYSHAVEGMDKDAALQVQRAIRGAA